MIDTIPALIYTISFISIAGSKGGSCCKRKGVPRNCLGICMGGCKDTPWENYKLVPTDNKCHKHERIAKECCKNNGNLRFLLKSQY